MRTRRTFLKETFVGATILCAAKYSPVAAFALRDSDTAGKLLFFSQKEYLIVSAVAERIIGVAASETSIRVAVRADAFLAAADPEIQEQFHLLLTVFNSPVFTFLFDLRFSNFLSMNEADKESYLLDWMTSNLAFRRTGFQGLKRLCMSMYYSDARSHAEIGYDGMFLPWERG